MKELSAIWQDKRSRVLLFIPPLIQLFVFSYAATLDVKNNSIGILNRDNGKHSFELIQRFKGSSFFNNIYELRNHEEVVDWIENERISTVLHFDEEFSRNILRSKPAKIQIILDGKRSNTAQIVFGYITKIVQGYNEELNPEGQKTVLVQRNWYNPNLIYTWFTVPGLVGVLSMLIALLVTALSIAREKELGTFEQLLVTPLTPFEILVGKVVPGIGIGILEGTFMMLGGILVFQIPFTGSLFGLYISLFVFVVSIIGVGLFISSLCSTQQQAVVGSSIFISPAVALSGFATPLENIPNWMYLLTYANPLKYFLISVRGCFLKGFTFNEVMLNTYPMLIIALFTLSGSAWFFRRRIT